MTRQGRTVFEGVPLHITQRGVDRCSTFRAEEDFAYYQWALHDAANATSCALHAYVLMTNHVHLLLTPTDAAGPSAMFQSLGRRYVRHFNGRYRRTGTLWEGRFRSAVVDSVPYLFACSRYIEMNPVRASMTDDPRSYPWSSYHHNVDGSTDPLLSEHPAYAALGNTRRERCAAYRAMFASPLTTDEVAIVRSDHFSRTRLRPLAV